MNIFSEIKKILVSAKIYKGLNWTVGGEKPCRLKRMTGKTTCKMMTFNEICYNCATSTFFVSI
jgi:hypothetical protein